MCALTAISWVTKEDMFLTTLSMVRPPLYCSLFLSLFQVSLRSHTDDCDGVACDVGWLKWKFRRGAGGVRGRCDRRLQARQGGLTGALVSRLRSKNPSQNSNKKVLPSFLSPLLSLPFYPSTAGGAKTDQKRQKLLSRAEMAVWGTTGVADSPLRKRRKSTQKKTQKLTRETASNDKAGRTHPH